MPSIDTIVEIFRYGHQTHLRLLDHARSLTDTQLDQPIDIGLGSIRRILRHTLAGESMWLKRMIGEIDRAWPDEKVSLTVDELSAEFATVKTQRDQFLASLSPDRLNAVQSYRDSKGALFTATLHEMLIQNALHSHHHRAQLGNALKRVAAIAIDLDYMQTVRKPV